jgi:four helix bundle protein
MPPSRDLRDRTAEFALRIVKFCSALPKAWAAQRIAGQLFDAGTAVGANYRAARRARSHREFVARIGVVLEESDESSFWLTLLKRRGRGAHRYLYCLTQDSKIRGRQPYVDRIRTSYFTSNFELRTSYLISAHLRSISFSPTTVSFPTARSATGTAQSDHPVRGAPASRPARARGTAPAR